MPALSAPLMAMELIFLPFDFDPGELVVVGVVVVGTVVMLVPLVTIVVVPAGLSAVARSTSPMP